MTARARSRGVKQSVHMERVAFESKARRIAIEKRLLKVELWRGGTLNGPQKNNAVEQNKMRSVPAISQLVCVCVCRIRRPLFVYHPAIAITTHSIPFGLALVSVL